MSDQFPPTPLPTPQTGVGYDGLPADNVSNAMVDANDEIMFFIVDNDIFDKDGIMKLIVNKEK